MRRRGRSIGTGIIAIVAGACIATAGACFDPTPPRGAPCSPTMACPAGQSCTAAGSCELPGGAIDAPPVVDVAPIDAPEPPGSDAPDAPDVDADSDGVPDRIDNCIGLANADQHDEDHDQRGDACDRCPHIADDGSNADNDGVADACDPHPDVPGDQIAFFDPFVAARADWNYGSGWTVTNDQLALDASGFHTARLLRPTPSGVIEIAGTIAWLATTPHKLAITFGTPQLYHYCEWYEDIVGAKAALTRNTSGTYDTLDQVMFTALPPGAFDLAANLDLTADYAQCRMKLGTRDDAPGASTPTLVSGDRIQIEGQNATIRIDYFIQITSPSP